MYILFQKNVDRTILNKIKWTIKKRLKVYHWRFTIEENNFSSKNTLTETDVFGNVFLAVVAVVVVVAVVISVVDFLKENFCHGEWSSFFGHWLSFYFFLSISFIWRFTSSFVCPLQSFSILFFIFLLLAVFISYLKQDILKEFFF